MKKSDWVVLLCGIGILILWAMNWFLVKHYIGTTTEQGLFGDMFGSINALFSGLTVVGLIYTIYLQREDIRLANEAVKDQKKQMIDNKTELQRQNRTLDIERFESTFFNLLNLHNEIIMSFPTKRQWFEHVYTTTVADQFRDLSSSAGIKNFKARYKNIEKSMLNNFSRYFGVLEKLFELVYESEILDSRTKDKYVSIVICQLSPDEKRILFYYFMFSQNQNIHFEKFKKSMFDDAFKSGDVIFSYHLEFLG